MHMYSGIITNCHKLNIRAAASADAEIVAVVDVYDKIFVDIEGEDGDYYKVKTPSGVEGYCLKANVSKLKNDRGECVHPNMGGGVTWVDLPLNDSTPMKYADGTPMTKKEFIDAFNNGPVCHSRDISGSAGPVIGYWINDSTSTIAYIEVNANIAPTLGFRTGVKFAEE